MIEDGYIFAVMAIVFGMGSCTGCIVAEKSRADKPAIIEELADPVIEKLDKLEEKVAQLASNRCMTVNTPILQVSVYDAGNLGTTPKVKK